MLKKCFLFLFLIMTGTGLMAQHQVTGKITDPSGEPIPGASILEKGTNNGTVTQMDGTYALEVSEDATLVFSFVGFETQEPHVDDQFSQLKQTFVDQGVPVIIGEYGVIHRTSLTGDAYDKHVEARNYYLEYVTRTAVDNGITPFYWDNGHDGDGGFALFDRSSGEVVDEPALNALMKGAGVID